MSSRRTTVLGVCTALVAPVAATSLLASPAAATPLSSACVDGGAPLLSAVVACAEPGTLTLTVPAGTTEIDVDVKGAGGGAGYPSAQHVGGDGADLSGALHLPTGTAYLRIIVGAGGAGQNSSRSYGGGGSAIVAESSAHVLIAKLAIAGGGGSGAYNGNGGDAGSPGTSTNNMTTSGPGDPGDGPTGGAGGSGNAPGSAGANDNPSSPTVAAGGLGGAASLSTGGSGGGGYAGGGGGGVDIQNFGDDTNEAGGGGGSSFASTFLPDAELSTAVGTGGIQLPGLIAGAGADGQVTLTFHGAPDAPTGVVATAKRNGAIVSFTAPASDNGSPITGYTITTTGGKVVATCAASPCTIAKLAAGASYRFTVHATNAFGDSAESAPSTAIKIASPPSATPRPPSGSRAWFRDPLSKAQRARLARVPKDPRRAHGRLRTTRALYRTHEGALAVPAPQVRKHQLTSGQAVQLTSLFAYDSPHLTRAGHHVLTTLARSMKRVRAIRCEGYTDFAGSLRHEVVLSRQRAKVVCKTLAHLLAGLSTRALGFGPDRPVVIGGHPHDREANRRVDLIVLASRR